MKKLLLNFALFASVLPSYSFAIDKSFTLEVGKPTYNIVYHYTKKSNLVTPDPNALVLHYDNGLFKDIEPHLTAYGLYSFEGSMQDKAMHGYYTLIPEKNNKVVYIKITYFNKSKRFEELIIMPNGQKALEEGYFEVKPNPYQNPDLISWASESNIIDKMSFPNNK